MLIGLVSDTHGRFEETLNLLFRRCDRILHAGDVGRAEVLESLELLAPVDAVCGNTDTGALAGLPFTWRRMFEGAEFVMEHIVSGTIPVEDPGETEEAVTRVHVFGHTHRPLVARRGATLWVNPGSAGPRRFDLPKTAGLLRLTPESIQVELRNIETPALPVWGEPLVVRRIDPNRTGR